MGITLEVRPDYLLVCVEGPFDTKKARDGLGDILRECAAQGKTRLLIDARGLSTPVSISDRYDLATRLADLANGRMRIAMLVSSANMFTKTLEDTATNRGLNVRTTDSLEEALEYLQVAESPA